MRLIIPLQGLVKGKCGFILGSIIPCALYYFFKLHLKKTRNNNTTNNSNNNITSPTFSPSSSSWASHGLALISDRAYGLSRPNDSPYHLGFDRAKIDAFHEIDNPNGVIQLGLAQNLLSLDLIEKWISENWDGRIVNNGGALGVGGICAYQPFDGLMDLKMVMANFMSKVMGNVSIDPLQLILTSGANPAVEILCFCLADHGNALLIPTPYYAGFDRDLVRTGVELIPIHCRSSENFTLTMPALDQAYNNARKRGLKVCGILFSNPSNPVGSILSRDKLCEIFYFAREKNIHIISDEVSAGSIYGNEKFISMAEIIKSEDIDKKRVHIIYGLSKDLSLAGFRVGAIYSSNENLLAASKKLARFSSISVPSQRLVISMLTDKRFIEEYMEINGKRLKRVHNSFVAGLDQLGIPCAKSDGGLYCWADFSKFIKPYSEKGELDLWEKLLDIGKVNINPGSAFHCIEPGWFRCCFTAIPENDISLVMNRIKKVCK